MIIQFHKRWIRVVFTRNLACNIMWDGLDSNKHIYHSDRPDGKRFEMKRGPKFAYNKLVVHKPSTGHRVWFYFPSGRCWHVDLYVDRRCFEFGAAESAENKEKA